MGAAQGLIFRSIEMLWVGGGEGGILADKEYNEISAAFKLHTSNLYSGQYVFFFTINNKCLNVECPFNFVIVFVPLVFFTLQSIILIEERSRFFFHIYDARIHCEK